MYGISLPQAFLADSVRPPDDEKKNALIGKDLYSATNPNAEPTEVDVTASFHIFPYFGSDSFTYPTKL